MTNKNWGTLEGSTPTYAETWVKLDGRIIVNPTDEQYRAAGKLPIVSPAPNPPEGQHVSGSSWSVVDDVITKSWTYAEDEPVVRTFSKLKCYAALRTAGYWTKVKSWLEEQDLWDAFVLAQDVREDDERFVAGLAAMKAALGLTDEQAEAILSQCVED